MLNCVFSNDVLSGVVAKKVLYSDVFVITEAFPSGLRFEFPWVQTISWG